MPDLGLTHVALSVRDLHASIAFYENYARMDVVHRRAREGVDLSGRAGELAARREPVVLVCKTDRRSARAATELLCPSYCRADCPGTQRPAHPVVGLLYMEHGLAKVLGFPLQPNRAHYALFNLNPGLQGLLGLVGGLLRYWTEIAK